MTKGKTMSRLQLALNVSNLEEAVDFYRRYFKSEPHKVRPGYANFEIQDPPLKLVLIEGENPGTINHLGVEVFSNDEVLAAATHCESVGLETTIETQTECCFAVQNKVWVSAPDGLPWETYVVTDDEPQDHASQTQSVTLGEKLQCSSSTTCC
jgi:catechol 2,3-dioxygenase-like lactoylglutathione lyase family enzyme